MVVTTSRQPAHRPETIRTRLARFMPKAVAAGWSVAWTAANEHAAEIASEDELVAADHLGCFGAALAHAMAKADMAPSRLRLTAETQDAIDDTPQPITLEVRAQIPGPALDPSIVEGIARRTEASCPVWKGLASEGRLRIVAVLEDPTLQATAPASPAPGAELPKSSARRVAAPQVRMSAPTLGRPSLPTWLTPKMALVVVGVAVVALRAFLLFSS